MQLDADRQGSTGQDSSGQARNGAQRPGQAVADSQGSSGSGAEVQGLAGTGEDRQSRQGEARKGAGRKGTARRALPEMASQGLPGPGSVRPGSAYQATGAPSRAPILPPGTKSAFTHRIRDGARVPRTQAAALAAVMMGLIAEGRGNHEALLEAARAKNSPIHSCFEWDDRKAAHAHRIEQARQYWKAIEIVVRVDDSTEKAQRAFHPVFIDGERQYQDIGTIARSESLMSQLLDAAKRDLIAFKHRYATISEAPDLADVFRAIEALDPKDAA